MGIKKCKICLKDKKLEEFGKHKECLYGVKTICKLCNNNLEKSKREKIKLENNITVENNLKKCCTCKIEKNLINFSKKSDMKDGYMKRCKKCVAEHHQKTKANIKITQKRYYTKNKKEINNYKIKWRNNKIKSDISFKTSNSMIISLRRSLKRNDIQKTKRTLDILGCSIDKFKTHIESQFLNWMNWNNYGNVCNTKLEYNCSWDLDHIIPLSSAKTKEDINVINHWSNFQPLCSKINRNIKKDNIFPCTNLELNITFNYNIN